MPLSYINLIFLLQADSTLSNSKDDVISLDVSLSSNQFKVFRFSSVLMTHSFFLESTHFNRRHNQFSNENE